MVNLKKIKTTKQEENNVCHYQSMIFLFCNNEGRLANILFIYTAFKCFYNYFSL